MLMFKTTAILDARKEGRRLSALHPGYTYSVASRVAGAPRRVWYYVYEGEAPRSMAPDLKYLNGDQA